MLSLKKIKIVNLKITILLYYENLHEKGKLVPEEKSDLLPKSN